MHVLWLGIVVVLALTVIQMVRAGFDDRCPTGRFNLRLASAFRDLLGDVINKRTPARPGAPAPGETVMTPEMTDTAREQAARGASKAEIARNLGVSRSTVSRHLHRRRTRRTAPVTTAKTAKR